MNMLFVCTAAVARSPIAVAIFRELVGRGKAHEARAVGTAPGKSRRQRGEFTEAVLASYEETWRAHLGAELRVGVWFRRLVNRLSPADLDALTELAITNGLMPLIRETARFNWHRELILGTLRYPGVLRIVLGRLLETSLARP